MQIVFCQIRSCVPCSEGREYIEALEHSEDGLDEERSAQGAEWIAKSGVDHRICGSVTQP